MKYSVENERPIFQDHYKIMEAQVTYESFDGSSITTRRLAFERGDSVAILLVEKETESVLLTNQFRYPTCKQNEGWLLEIPAGSLEKDEKPTQCIKREVMEELGYNLNHPDPICNFYVSPGASTERIFLFYGEVSEKDRIGKGGGNTHEHEDIALVKIPVSEISMEIPKLKDAKTILALQWLLLKNRS